MERAWAIASPYGLYQGSAFTKRLAIAQHVWAYNETLYNRGFPHTQSSALDAIQKQEWERLKKQGDRAVKIEMKIIK